MGHLLRLSAPPICSPSGRGLSAPRAPISPDGRGALSSTNLWPLRSGAFSSTNLWPLKLGGLSAPPALISPGGRGLSAPPICGPQVRGFLLHHSAVPQAQLVGGSELHHIQSEVPQVGGSRLHLHSSAQMVGGSQLHQSVVLRSRLHLHPSAQMVGGSRLHNLRSSALSSTCNRQPRWLGALSSTCTRQPQ